MPTRAQVQELVRSGIDYTEIGARFGIAPGQAYLIATGLAADGSDTPSASVLQRPGALASSQHLANPSEMENTTERGSVHDWIRRRVMPDEQMRRAAQAQVAGPSEETESDVQPDGLDLLVRDHNKVDALLKQLAAIPGATKGGTPAQRSARTSIVDLITEILSAHEAAEEKHLWPFVRKTLPDGRHRARTALQQEQEGKDLLTRLGRLDGDAEEFDELVEKLSAACRTHVAFEDHVFLDLRHTVSRDRLLRLGSKIDRARKHGPTRPHRHAPSSPPALDLAGAVGTGSDRLRDTLGERPADRRGRPSEAARRRTEEDR